MAGKNQPQGQDTNDLLKVRREKLQNLQADGKDPFLITKYDVTHHSLDIKEHFEELEGKEVSAAGRMMFKRVMGKASFCNIQDLKGKIQAYVARDDIGEDSYKDLVKKVLQKAWDSKPIVGSQRYYDGLVHFLAMLHLTGNFKIWKPKPTVESEEKTINETEINGVTYNDGDKVDYFEGCKLYKATIAKKAAPEPDSVTTPDSTDAVHASFAMHGAVRVWSNGNSLFVENAPANTKIIVADLNGRVLKLSRATSASQEIRLNNKGPMLVMVGKKSYTVIK